MNEYREKTNDTICEDLCWVLFDFSIPVEL